MTITYETMLKAAAARNWMEEEGYLARGYHMTKWGCVIGSRKKESA